MFFSIECSFLTIHIHLSLFQFCSFISDRVQQRSEQHRSLASGLKWCGKPEFKIELFVVEIYTTDRPKNQNTNILCAFRKLK